jgi:hypothetical protein
MREVPTAIRFKVCTWIAVSLLVTVMAWQCVTRPVEQGTVSWVESEFEIKLAEKQEPIPRPPTAAEVAIRAAACTASLLTGLALVRRLQSKR